MDLFTTAQWRAGGRSAVSLRRAVDSGDVRRLLRGVYACCDVPDLPETRARAVDLVRPGDTAVGRTVAAWLSGIDVLPPGASVADEPIHLVVPKGTTPPRLPGCRASQADLPATDVVRSFGVTRTTDARTALDLARFAPRPQAVASVDAFLNRGRVDLPTLWMRARALTRVRNCRRLRANLAAADAGAQSCAESLQRVLFVDAGLPRPRTQIPVRTPAGELLGYLDMGWSRYRLASEYDGEEFHDAPGAAAGDLRRRARIAAEGWTVDVVRRHELFGQPAALVARTAEMLLTRGWTPPTPVVLDQISRAARYEAETGLRWEWMPLQRLLAA